MLGKNRHNSRILSEQKDCSNRDALVSCRLVAKDEPGADDVIAYQIRQSFAPGEITPEEMNRLGCELAGRFTKGNHAYVVCTHIDKAAERRMEEIAALRKQIVTYVRTREVYVAYRKAGYAKKFLAEHEAEILLYKAAKKAFDELGVKKLPIGKELQEEYAKLAAEKKMLYGAYRKARTEMRELLTVKENVDQLLENGEGKEGKEREHEEQR